MTNRLPENEKYTQTGGLDAVDALICLCCRVERSITNQGFILVGTRVVDMGSPDWESYEALYHEVQDHPVLYDKLLQQKGASLGT